MIRTNVIYDGVEYVIGNQTAEKVKAQIEQIHPSGTGRLTVNYGAGRLQSAEFPPSTRWRRGNRRPSRRLRRGLN